jgi:hypothetical protein
MDPARRIADSMSYNLDVTKPTRIQFNFSVKLRGARLPG